MWLWVFAPPVATARNLQDAMLQATVVYSFYILCLFEVHTAIFLKHVSKLKWIFNLFAHFKVLFEPSHLRPQSLVQFLIQVLLITLSTTCSVVRQYWNQIYAGMIWTWILTFPRKAELRSAQFASFHLGSVPSFCVPKLLPAKWSILLLISS